MGQVLNIFNLHIVYEKYHTGVDRYLQMYSKGITSSENAKHIRIHSIYFTNDKKVLFPDISMDDQGVISALMPLPQNTQLLFKDYFWKKRYNNVVLELLTPLLKSKTNLVFQCHNLFLTDLTELLRDEFSGKMILHLHCLPWKFSSENDRERFNKLYHLNESQNYDDFRSLEKSSVKYNSADLIIALSESARDYLVNIHQIPLSKITIVPNGLDRQLYIKPEHTREKVLLYVGKVSRDKGAFELLETLSELNRRGIRVKLKVAGAYNETIEKHMERFAGLDIELLGQISFDQLQELYATCTAGVIPSLHEQCSYVALEMAMYGMPLIVSDVDALSEIFDHGETALKVPMVFDPDFGISADHESFMDSIITILENTDLQEKLSANIRQLYLDEYTLEKMVENTLNAYEIIS